MLAIGNESSFWRKLVMQYTHVEPAVRHSVIAISLLHEQMHQSTELGLRVPKLKHEFSSLKHYNLAIRELKSMDANEKQPVVLFVCILFVCIELLQENRDIALQHCKHGLAILEQVVYRFPWTQEHLIPIFRRLSILLHLFGNELSDIPTLDVFAIPQYESFETFTEAHYQMDETCRRTLRLARRGDEYRVGNLMGQPVAEDLLVEQGAVIAMLDNWHSLFMACNNQSFLMTNSTLTEMYDVDNDYLHNMARKLLSSRYKVCRLWCEMAFATDEISYDDHMDTFREVQESLQAMDLIPTQDPESLPRPLKFSFEVGFLPVVYFLVTKCRDIRIRLQALRLIKVLGVPQENMWNTLGTFHLCRRIVEIEHAIVLDFDGKPLNLIPTELPSDLTRIRHTSTSSQLSQQVIGANVVTGRSVKFLLPTADGAIMTHEEFLCVDPSDLEEDTSEDDYRSPSLECDAVTKL